jgi:ADP-glucose pyrophosphorylase
LLCAGEITHSILSQNVRVGNGSVVRDSLIMANVTIGENVTIEHAIIGENAKSPTTLMSSARTVKSKLSDMLKL